MPQPTISVVIRTLNEAPTLGAVFAALTRQQRPPDEVLVVDSGSTDGTPTIARQQGAQVLTLAPHTFSYGRALNIGFAASSGTIVVPLSGHAVPASPQWLATLSAPLDLPRVAAVSSKLVCPPGSKLHNYWNHLPFLVHQRPATNTLWLFWNTAAAYRKAVWEQFPFNEAVPGCEDREWALRVLAQGWTVRYVPQAQVWHAHDESYRRFLRRMLMTGRMLRQLKPDCPRRTPHGASESLGAWD